MNWKIKISVICKLFILKLEISELIKRHNDRLLKTHFEYNDIDELKVTASEDTPGTLNLRGKTWNGCVDTRPHRFRNKENYQG